MSQSPLVVIVAGGDSAEANSSWRSASALESALKRSFHTIVVPLDNDFPKQVLSRLDAVIFPVTHGGAGEDGTLQGFLELMGLRYVGSGVRASSIAMHKPSAHALHSSLGLRVPKHRVIRENDSLGASIRLGFEALGSPLVVKPSSGGSSLEVRLCHTKQQTLRAATQARAAFGEVLLEERLIGRELTVALNATEHGLAALPAIDVSMSTDPVEPWPSVGSRASNTISSLSPADLRMVEAAARRSFEGLGCRDWARADVFVSDESEVTLLETNLLPGLTESSPYVQSIHAAGQTLEQWACERIRIACSDRAD